MSKFLLCMYEMYKFSTLNFFKVTCLCTFLFILVVVVVVCVCVCVRERECIYMYQAWELSSKMQIFAALKLTFHGEKQLSAWKRNQRYKKEKKKEALVLVSHRIATKHICSHAAITRLGHVIVNTVTHCYSRGLATGLNAVILTHFCAMFRLRKSERYNCFESKISEFFRINVCV